MQELLDADERRARFKIRVLGDRTIDAFASFFPLSGTAAQDQIEAWELLRRIPHANLSKSFAAGRREIEGAEVVYVVLRKPDETLNGVLLERPLNKEEATEVLLSGARALEHLGRHGLAHACVSPDHVLAVRDLIQLSAEGVRKADDAAGAAQSKAKYVAPESTQGNATIAAGTWCLGATAFETLTQTSCGEGCRERVKQLPLGWVLERCLESEPNARCKPEEIPAIIRSGPPPAIAPPPPQVVQTAATPGASSVGAQEIKPAGPAVAGASVAAAATAASAANPVSPAVPPPPSSAPTVPPAPELPPSRPAASSLSQARTKAFQQAGFDALTAPNGPADARPKATASAAAQASPSSPALGAAQTSPAATEKASTTGARIPSAVGGNRAYASAGPLGADSARRVGRTIVGIDPEPQRSRWWLYMVGGLAVLLFVIWALRSKPVPAVNRASTEPAAAAQNAAAPAASTNTTSTASKAWPTRTLEPDKAEPATTPVPANTAATKTNAASVSGPVWRVVVYTFNRQEDAERKVRALNAKHPHLEAQVFTPNGQTGPYLVTVGGRMMRQDAARFRLRALASGMPRDSYIQNYKP